MVFEYIIPWLITSWTYITFSSGVLRKLAPYRFSNKTKLSIASKQQKLKNVAIAKHYDTDKNIFSYNNKTITVSKKFDNNIWHGAAAMSGYTSNKLLTYFNKSEKLKVSETNPQCFIELYEESVIPRL